MNATQGYLAKYNQRSISDEASGGLFNYEQLANLVADVYSQIYEQRAAASLSKYFYKARDAEYIENLKKPVQEQLAKLDFADQIQGIKRTDEAYERIARAAAGKISELDDITKKRSALAKGLNLSYMAMTQSAQVYSDALAGGYDRRTAGAATLMSAAGQFALMSNNPLGTWFLDKTVGYTNEKAGMVAAYNNLIKDKLPKIQEGIEALAVNKKVGKNLIGTAFKDVKNGIKNYIGSAGLSTGTGNNIVRNAVVEGIEEVSEQAVMDASKGVIDFLSYLGFGGTQGSFGGFENVFSPTGLQNYLANFVGGVIGGSLFELERSVITPILSGNGVPKETQLGVIDYISNGKTKEFLDIAKEQSKKFGSNTLSPLPTDVNGEKVFLESKDLTQGDFIYQAVENYVNNIDKILNSENIKQDNES